MPEKSMSKNNKKAKGDKRNALSINFLGKGLARDAAEKLRARDRRIRNL